MEIALLSRLFRSSRVQALATSACWLTVACTAETPLPAGVTPLEANTAPVPSQPGDPYPETQATVTGSTADYDWAHGQGYIAASPGAVWKALHDPEVVVDRHGTSAHSVTSNSEPQYSFSFRIDYQAGGVEWQEAWRYAVQAGSEAAPEQAMIRSQKIAGTTFIKRLEGQITVLAVAGHPDRTLVQQVAHIKAVGSNAQTAKKTLDDQFSSLLAKVKGQPLP